jgi:hypothetical protein
MNGVTRHGLSFPEFSRPSDQSQRFSRDTVTVISFRQPEETCEKLTPVK